ncbi:unnamed protein product, partial [Effrenium voratum]
PLGRLLSEVLPRRPAPRRHAHRPGGGAGHLRLHEAPGGERGPAIAAGERGASCAADRPFAAPGRLRARHLHLQRGGAATVDQATRLGPGDVASSHRPAPCRRGHHHGRGPGGGRARGRAAAGPAPAAAPVPYRHGRPEPWAAGYHGGGASGQWPL